MRRTLSEFLAGIFLEEGLVRHGAGKVVNHELGNRVDLLLGVTRVPGDGLIL